MILDRDQHTHGQEAVQRRCCPPTHIMRVRGTARMASIRWL